MLKREAKKYNMFNVELQSYVGILFDEVKVKEDLVYDKVSGELIGYCHLDSIGNHTLDMKHIMKASDGNIAKYVLLLMVCGVYSSLKFPLAGFATQAVSSDIFVSNCMECCFIARNPSKH